jgi:hypothetical protein
MAGVGLRDRVVVVKRTFFRDNYCPFQASQWPRGKNMYTFDRLSRKMLLGATGT